MVIAISRSTESGRWSADVLSYSGVDMTELSVGTGATVTEVTQRADAQRYDILDGKRHITFEGWRIGEATSRTESSDRWIDMALYVSAAGTYVLSKVGCSDVFHVGACRRPSKGQRKESLAEALTEDDAGYDPKDIFVPCRECRPDFDATPVWVETDMPSVQLFTTVELLFDALQQKKGGSVRSLSRVSRALLEEAREWDPAVARLLDTPMEIQ